MSDVQHSTSRGALHLAVRCGNRTGLRAIVNACPSARQDASFQRKHVAPGFTLVEILVCAILLGIGFLALVAAFGHESVCAQRGEDAVIATFLADEIRDLALQMDFADVFDLDAAPYNPAILSTGASAGLAGWSQHVTVLPVNAMDLNAAVSEGAATAARLTVEVRRYAKPVLVQTYYIFSMAGVPFTDDS